MDLNQWLTATQARRDELDAHGKAEFTDDPSQRRNDMELAIQDAHDAGKLLADAESFLVQAEAMAVLAAREKYPDLSAPERKIMAKEMSQKVARLVTGLSVTVKTLNNRIFVLMNQNRSRL